MFAGLILLFSQTYLTSSSSPTSSPSSVSTCSPNPLTPPSLTDCRMRPTPVALQTPSEGETRFQLKTERFNLNIAFVLQTFSLSDQVSLKLTAAQVNPSFHYQPFIVYEGLVWETIISLNDNTHHSLLMKFSFGKPSYPGSCSAPLQSAVKCHPSSLAEQEVQL